MLALLVTLVLAAPGGERVDFGTTPARRVRLLRHDNPAVRRKAALLLAHAPADSALAALLVALSDPSAQVRGAAASSLQVIRDERAVPFLVTRAREERSPGVLAGVLLALGRCGKPYVARHMTPFLEHPHRSVRAAAAAALGHIGDAGQRDALWAALRFAPDDPRFGVRVAVLSAFVNLGWRDDVARALDELEKAGGMRHWQARAGMLAAIGRARIEGKTAWVRAQLAAAADPRVIAAAAGALAGLGEIDEVYALTRHEVADVRRAALVALQEVGDARALPRAAEMVKTDVEPVVRFEAALVLHHGDHPDADVYLVDALRSRNPLFWIEALSALEKKYDRSYGRDAEAWTAYFKTRARRK